MVSFGEFVRSHQGTLTVVRHGQDWNLGDRAIAALDTASSLIYGRQISVHVTWIASSAGHFLSCCRDFTQGIAVRCKVGEND